MNDNKSVIILRKMTLYYHFLRKIGKMEKILERLCKLVNYEMEKGNDTILSFSVKCEISYQEMRRTANGTAKDIKISTISKICENTDIQMMDIFVPNKGLDVVVRYNNERFHVSVEKC